ncbi:MAG: PEGA domain-containing protein [Lachnospiraceae bacterium]|nr:PEGA domain-containing protein [Lachnospiraceae bacterium]
MRKLWLYFLIAICSVTLLCGCGNNEEEDASPKVSISRKPAAVADSEDEEEKEEADALFMVQSFIPEEEKIVLRSMNYGKNYVYKYSLGTKFLDKYGDSTSVLNFLPGSVVELGDRNSSGALESIQLSDEVWTFEDVEKFEIDTDNGIFNLNDTNYKLSDSTVVFSNGVEGKITDIGSDDILYVVGKDKEIISISVTTGHGYLMLANTDKFEGSLIYIGNEMITTVTKDMTVTIPEGIYDVTVANNGYGGTKSVTVVRNETTLLDLAELEGEGPKVCKLTVTATVEGAVIYLDNTLIESGVETEVQYGKHKLSIAVEGYDTWSKTLYVNSETANISIDPTETDTEEEESEESEKSSSSSSDNNSSSSDTSSSTSSPDNSSTDSSSSSSGSNSNSSSSTDSEVDYLSTLSSLISTLSGSD